MTTEPPLLPESIFCYTRATTPSQMEVEKDLSSSNNEDRLAMDLFADIPFDGVTGVDGFEEIKSMSLDEPSYSPNMLPDSFDTNIYSAPFTEIPRPEPLGNVHIDTDLPPPIPSVQLDQNQEPKAKKGILLHNLPTCWRLVIT